MKQLATVQSAIVDTFIRVELAKAGIPAFQFVRLKSGDMHSSMIGLMRFTQGGEAVFVRGDQYWSARLSMHVTGPEQFALRHRFGDQIYNDGDTGHGGSALFEPFISYNFTCYSVEALIGLVGILVQKCGAQHTEAPDRPGKILQTYDFLDSDCLLAVPPPANAVDLARLEITGLRGWGRMMGNKYDILDCDLEALTIAEAVIGKKSRDAEVIVSSLCNLSKEMVDLATEFWQTGVVAAQPRQACQPVDMQTHLRLVDSIKRGARNGPLAGVEWWLTVRLDVLKRARRFREMASVVKRTEVVRAQLFGAYVSWFETNVGELMAAHSPRRDSQDCLLHQTLLCKRLAQLCTRMGMKAAAAHYDAQYPAFAAELDPGRKARVEMVLLSPIGTD